MGSVMSMVTSLMKDGGKITVTEPSKTALEAFLKLLMFCMTHWETWDPTRAGSKLGSDLYLLTDDLINQIINDESLLKSLGPTERMMGPVIIGFLQSLKEKKENGRRKEG